MSVLSHVDDWQFDAFALERATDGRPLSLLAFALLKRQGITARLGINEHKLVRCGCVHGGGGGGGYLWRRCVVMFDTVRGCANSRAALVDATGA